MGPAGRSAASHPRHQQPACRLGRGDLTADSGLRSAGRRPASHHQRRMLRRQQPRRVRLSPPRVDRKAIDRIAMEATHPLSRPRILLPPRPHRPRVLPEGLLLGRPTGWTPMGSHRHQPFCRLRRRPSRQARGRLHRQEVRTVLRKRAAAVATTNHRQINGCIGRGPRAGIGEKVREGVGCLRDESSGEWPPGVLSPAAPFPGSCPGPGRRPDRRPAHLSAPAPGRAGLHPASLRPRR